jgi:hypothetical protein
MQQPPSTATVGVVGTTQQPPTVEVAINWSVLIPIIATAVCLVVAQFFTSVLTLRNGWKTDENSKKSDAIHVLVNSGMTKALADLAAAQEEIRILRDMVQSLNTRLGLDVTTTRPSRAEIEQAQKVIDAGRLPTAEVLAAQASTPKRSEP